MPCWKTKYFVNIYHRRLTGFLTIAGIYYWLPGSFKRNLTTTGLTYY